MKLIVQIPAFNEEKTIAQTLRDVPKKIDGFTSVETLVIDDGSRDGTAEAARRAGATHVIHLKNHRGLSAAFLAGIEAALRLGADVIVNTDADNQYAGADIAKLVAPIVGGSAEVVVGDRDVANSPHMSGFKRALQRLGSWVVGRASGLEIADVTSGFRAFSREAALQINVFNPFTYTLETIIQAGNRNLGVQTVKVRTNAPTRPSRLYRGLGMYLRKSIATVFRVYTLYSPLKAFFSIGSLLMLAGAIVGSRFLWHAYHDHGAEHMQQLIACSVLLMAGFQTWLIALLADIIGVNRRLHENILIRLKRLDLESRPAPRPRDARPPRPSREERPARGPADRPSPPVERPAPAERAAAPAAAAKPATQWVWLLDEDKLAANDAESVAEPDDAEEIESPQEKASGSAGAGGRRRRRRRGGVRHAAELPGNRGKHLDDSGEGE